MDESVFEAWERRTGFDRPTEKQTVILRSMVGEYGADRVAEGVTRMELTDRGSVNFAALRSWLIEDVRTKREHDAWKRERERYDGAPERSAPALPPVQFRSAELITNGSTCDACGYAFHDTGELMPHSIGRHHYRSALAMRAGRCGCARHRFE